MARRQSLNLFFVALHSDHYAKRRNGDEPRRVVPLWGRQVPRRGTRHDQRTVPLQELLAQPRVGGSTTTVLYDDSWGGAISSIERARVNGFIRGSF